MNSKKLDLLGIGIGPFNLSLAALLAKVENVDYLFLEKKPKFSWHDELMFGDSNMQTSYLKDLVTPVDPTNPHSFLNYLSKKGLIYQFLNSGRKTVKREEFQDYCRWCAFNLQHHLAFESEVEEVKFENGAFEIRTSNAKYQAQNLCVGTGHIPNIPTTAFEFLGNGVFHIKDGLFEGLNLTEKRVAIVGGGQTGVEIFRNALKGRWGKAREITLVSSRPGLRPLESGPFVDEYFTPGFVSEFLRSSQESKDCMLHEQKMASDGNTPEYLQNLYEELYFARNYSKQESVFRILPMRRLRNLSKLGDIYRLELDNLLYEKGEELGADIVILATGFRSALPKAIEGLLSHMKFDSQARPRLNEDYTLITDLPADNRIYAMNLSRHFHGIADPQVSMMAWRSAVIINSLLEREHYATGNYQPNFCQYGLLNGQEGALR